MRGQSCEGKDYLLHKTTKCCSRYKIERNHKALDYY